METTGRPHGAADGSAAHQSIRERVRLGRAALTREIVSAGALRVGATLLGGFALGVGLHLLVRSGSAVAWGLTLAFLGGLGLVAWRFLARPLAGRPDDSRFVEWLDARLAGHRPGQNLPADAPAPAARNLIVTAWQLGDKPDLERSGFAPDLVQAIVQRGAAAAAGVPVSGWRERGTDRRWQLVLGAAALVLLGLFGLAGPQRFGSAALKVVDPRRAVLVPPGIDVQPGNLTVEKGDDVPLAVAVRGSAETPLLRVREGGGIWMTRRLDAPTRGPGDPEQAPLLYASELKDVERDLEYEVQVGKLRSAVAKITVNEPPRVSGFEITYAYPDYTGKPAETVTTGTGDMAALVGTRVRLKALANRTMPTAFLKSGLPGAPELTDRRELTNAGHDTWEATFTIDQSFDYEIGLGDMAGAPRFATGRFHVEAVPDRAPVVRLLYPEGDMKIPEEMNLALQAEGVDDFGLSRLDLVYEIKDGKSGRIRLRDFRAGAADFQAQFPWDLTPYNLTPGNEVSYYLELYDNDTLHGPKAARSDVRRLRFPTMDEIYAEVHEEHDEQIDNLSSALDKSEELKKEMDKLSRDMKREGQMDWEKKKEVESLMQKQQELAKQLDEAARQLDEAMNKAQDQTMMSPELLQKMQEISDLMQSIKNEKMKEAFQRLSEAMQKMDKDAVNKAMQDMKVDQEQMAKSIERTLEMLKEIKKDELMEDAVRKAEEMAQKQEDLANKAKDAADPKKKDGADKGDKKGEAKDADKKDGDKKDGEQKDGAQKDGDAKNPDGKDPQGKDADKKDGSGKAQDKPGSQKNQELAKEQEDIKKQAEQLQKQMDELSKLAENEPDLKKDLDQARDQDQQQQMQDDMDQSQQQMEKNEMEKALNFAFKARDKAKNLAKQLNQAKQQSNAQKKREQQERMMAVIQDLVDVSSAQEELVAQADATDDGEMAARQQVIAEGVVRAGVQLEALGRRTLFVTPEQGSKLTTALNKMKNATRSFTSGQRNMALRDSRESTGDLNETIVQLMQAQQSMCNMPSPSGSAESMQKMQSLSQQQQNLNGQSQSMQSQGSSPRMTAGQKEAMERLAAQQEMIKKGLDEVAGELKGRRDVLGRMDQLSKEMAEVAEQLRKSGVDQKLTERQQKILSRLLDAQRSIRKRDDDNQREARTAEQLFRPGSPPPLNPNLLNGADRLRSDILKGQNDNYPSQYRGLVEQYFRALSDKKNGAAGKPAAPAPAPATPPATGKRPR